MGTSTSEWRASVAAPPRDVLACGEVLLHLGSREMRRGDATTVLQEQPFQILRLLLSRPGSVVSREELRRHLWPDGTFVDYEHSLNAAIKRLRAALADDASAPRFVETVPRRGYRWKASPARRGHPVRLAIMPFTADAAARAFSSGVTDELATQLGQRGHGCVQVISRLSASACGSTPQRASDVAAALGADYVMDGSVRADSRRARIAVWLVDAREEVQLWADAYERQLDEPLAAQVDVASAVAESIVSVLRK